MTTLFDKLFGTFLGIEFREDSLVVTYLKNSLAGTTLLSSATFLIKDMRESENTVNEIREYVGKHGVNVNGIFASIPDKWVIAKFTDIPSLKGKGKNALSSLMRFEIERHIPFNIEDVIYDFLVLKETGTACSVAFVAVQKEKMDLVREFLEKLTLRPQAVTISSFAVLNMIELSGVSAVGLRDLMGITYKSKSMGKKGDANISLHIDKTNANLTIVGDSLCIHHRSFSLSPANKTGMFLDDIARYLAELQSRLSIERFNKMIISGDTASFANVAEELKEKLKLNIITVDKLARYSGNVKGIEINNVAASVGACFAGLGLGTYKINLLPHKAGHETSSLGPLTAKVLLVLILSLGAGIFTTEAVKRKKYLARIDQELKKNGPVITAIEKLTSDISELKKRTVLLQGLKESEITLEALAELSGLLPKDAWITTLDYKGPEIKDEKTTQGELVLNGFAGASSALIPLLEDSPFFEKVVFVGPIRKVGDKEQFKLSAKVVIPAKEKDAAELKAEGGGQKAEGKDEEGKKPGKEEEKSSGGPAAGPKEGVKK